MTVNSSARKMYSGDLEEWLSKIFVPVEPSERFIKRLKARLIRIHGRRPLSGWMLIGTAAMVIMLVFTGLGFALRILIGLFSLLGLIGRKGRIEEHSSLTAAGD